MSKTAQGVIMKISINGWTLEAFSITLEHQHDDWCILRADDQRFPTEFTEEERDNINEQLQAQTELNKPDRFQDMGSVEEPEYIRILAEKI
jgi:hypothetical protein